MPISSQPRPRQQVRRKAYHQRMSDARLSTRGFLKRFGGSLMVVGCNAASIAFTPFVSAQEPGEVELPELGDTTSGIVSISEERRIGEALLRQVRRQVPTVNDPILKYFAEVSLYRITEFADLPDANLFPVLIDSSELNAFAAPGGIVGINLGLLLDAQDVHEFSGVLAHELAHLSQRHFARGLEARRASMFRDVAAFVAALVVAATAGGDAGLAALGGAQTVSAAGAMRYSRSLEGEADRVAINTMHKAGLDPMGLSRMFERMQQRYRFRRTPPAYLLSHPLSEERIADTKQQAARYPQLEYSDSRSYQMMRARALVRYAESPQAAVDYWQSEVEAGEQPHIARYGLAYALASNDKAAHGLDTLRPMQNAFDDSLLFAASKAELMIEAGEIDQALSFLQRQLILNPDNAPLSMLRAQALTAGERFAEATEVLKRQSVLHPEDYDVWFELAETAGLADDIMQVHTARAEFFALTGDFESSLQQLEFAASLANPAQFELVSGLSQRIRDLRGALTASR